MPHVISLASSPHTLAAPEVLSQLRVRPDIGLSSSEALRRRNLHGGNSLPGDKPRRALFLFLSRFSDALVLLLLGAAVVSILFGKYGDASIILAAVFVDALLTFIQSWRTEQTLARMREQIRDVVQVLRDGETFSLPAEELVLGDIIRIRSGRHVPADARLLSCQALRTQEAALTGEATEIIKSTGHIKGRASISGRHNMIFAGTSVVAGSGTAVVTAVGMQTEFGKIATVIRGQVSPSSPLRRHLQTTGLLIGSIVIACVVLLTLYGLFLGQPLATTFHTAITLIVSAIPEDLTMILTIALTVGVLRISRKGGVVRQLSAAETLGAATVICTDKTGTLTQGKMEAIRFDFMQGRSMAVGEKPHAHMEELAYIGLALATDAYKISDSEEEIGEHYFGSATERSALAFVEQSGVLQESLRKQWKVTSLIQFSSQWKYRAALANHPTQSGRIVFAVGAPEVLLERSSTALDEKGELVALTSEKRVELLRKLDELGNNGSRLLAVTIKRHESETTLSHRKLSGLSFLGVLLIEDPIRPDVIDAIAQTQQAGVAVKLVTGDHLSTAKAVARAIGLSVSSDTVCAGEEIRDMSDSELLNRLPRLQVIARVEPLDKQRIVRLLQKQGHVVAMTGDGINDAVALKGADIGVAMGSGTDIAKDASDLVLLNDSFATIVAAITEGRVLRDNIRKVIAFLLSTNMAEVLIFFASLIFKLPLPLLPAQLLWINIVTDGTSDIALSLEPAEEDVMRRGPEDPKRLLLGRHQGAHIVYGGLIMTIATMLTFWYVYTTSNQDLVYSRTMAFAFLATTSLLSVWSFRSPTKPLWKLLWGNPWVFVSAGFSFCLQVIAIHTPALAGFFNMVPLSMADWLLIAAGSALTVVLMDIRKFIFPHRFQGVPGKERSLIVS